MKGPKNWRAWLGALLSALAVVAAAVAVAVIATDWRDDLDQLSHDVTDLRDEVRELRATLEPGPGVTPTPSPGATPTPEPDVTPAPTPVVVTMANGAVVDWQGMRLTVEGYRLGSSEVGPRADFTLENIDGPPESSGFFQTVKVVDKDGFVCSSGSMATGSEFQTLEPGEKLTFGVYWNCRNRIVRTLSLGGGVIVFEFPQAQSRLLGGTAPRGTAPR
jgi:hypothetical protein